jgi:hypothetical protein
MDHGFFTMIDPRPDPEELRAAMLEVDLISLRLRVAVAKADVQLRTAHCATLEHSTVARLMSREAREAQRAYLEQLRAAVRQYAHLLGTSGASREQVVGIVKETVNEVTTRGARDSTTVTAVVARALQMYYDTPAA